MASKKCVTFPALLNNLAWVEFSEKSSPRLLGWWYESKNALALNMVMFSK